MTRFRKSVAIVMISLLMTTGVQASTIKGLEKNNTNCVPIRTISDELGANVYYDPNTKKITISYKDNNIEMTLGSKIAKINGEKKTLQVAPQVVDGVTYVPIRFVGEALGGTVSYKNSILEVTIDGVTKVWDVQTISTASTTNAFTATSTFESGTQVVLGKRVTYVTINMNDPKVKVKIATADGKVTAATALKTLAGTAKVSVNGTYFAAYNGDVPLPDGTLVVNKKAIHITDIGSTIGFTADNKVLIDFVKTRVQGYVNGQEAWVSYRVNRPTTDASATILYTPEYGGKIPLPSGWSAVVCINDSVAKIVKESRKVPENGYILVTKDPSRFNIGDMVGYKTTFQPQNTSEGEWEDVVYALSAGPSLIINGQKTGNPANEQFTEEKILTQAAQRSFIGVTSDNKVIIGTVSASVSELKNIVKQMGLKSAMCLDGGASSGLYYNGSYLTNPGRNISNSINFLYN